jgi:hypothetical protein
VIGGYIKNIEKKQGDKIMYTVEIKEFISETQHIWRTVSSLDTEGRINEWTVIFHHPMNPELPIYTLTEAQSLEHQLTSAVWGYEPDNVRIVKA